MRPDRSRICWNRLTGHAVLIAGIALFAASPALAGLGDMVKKATNKAVKGAEEKATPAKPCPPVEYDQITLELTNERVEAILATFKAAGAAGADRPPQVEKLNKLNDERGKIDEKHGETVRELQRKRGDIEVCYYDGYSAAKDRRVEEYRARALSDPDLLAKYSKLAQENAAAGVPPESALMRVSRAAMTELNPTKEDSAQVRKSCGPIPPKSADELKLEALDKQILAVNDTIAKIDAKVARAQAKQGAMDSEQWSTALERLRAYVGYRRSHPGDSGQTGFCGFSKTEIEAIEKHLEQLNAVIG